MPAGIDVDPNGPVARVTLDGAGGYAALADALRSLRDADGVRALLLSGRWDCAPADLPATPDGDPVAELAALPFPSVAWIDGLCAEEGFELALAADVRCASPRAAFRIACAAQGRMPTHGGAVRLARVAGTARALHLLLTGETLDSADACRDGIAVPAANAGAALAVAEAVAEAAPVAARYVREAVRAAGDLPLADGLRLEADLSVLLHTTRDRAEGLRSFAEKRPPRYEGR